MHLRGVATPMIRANKPYHHHIYICTLDKINVEHFSYLKKSTTSLYY